MRKIIVSISIFLIVVFSAFGQESVLYFEIQQAKKSNVHFKNIVLKEANTNETVFLDEEDDSDA